MGYTPFSHASQLQKELVKIGLLTQCTDLGGQDISSVLQCAPQKLQGFKRVADTDFANMKRNFGMHISTSYSLNYLTYLS